MANIDEFRRDMKFIEKLLKKEQKSNADIFHHGKTKPTRRKTIQKQDYNRLYVDMADRIILHKLGKMKEEDGTF